MWCVGLGASLAYPSTCCLCELRSDTFKEVNYSITCEVCVLVLGSTTRLKCSCCMQHNSGHVQYVQVAQGWLLRARFTASSIFVCAGVLIDEEQGLQ